MLRDEIVAQSDLLDAITEALKRKGVYSKVKANLRAEVYHILEDKSTVGAPDKPRDVFLASELIREFLMRFNLQNTLSVFSEEMGQPPQMTVDRTFVGAELGLDSTGSDPSLPLLVLLVQHLINSKPENLSTANESVIAEPDEELSS